MPEAPTIEVTTHLSIDLPLDQVVMRLCGPNTLPALLPPDVQVMVGAQAVDFKGVVRIDFTTTRTTI